MKTIRLARRLAVPAAALMLASVAAPALADDDDMRCSGGPSGARLSMDEVVKKAEEQGYTVRGAEMEDGCWEIYALGEDGGRYEMYLHPVSGEIVKLEKKS